VEAQGLPDLSARRSRILGDGDRRGLILSTTSTVVVLAALLAVFLLAPGSGQVRHTFFNPADMWQAFVGNPKAGYYSVGEALWLNIRMFLAAEAQRFLVSFVVIRSVKHDIAAVAARGGHFDQRSRQGHDDSGPDTEVRSVVGHGLRMIASRGCDHSSGALLRGET